MSPKYYVLALPFIGLFILGFKSPRTISDLLEEGLVAHYTFNKCDARDITGNNPNGEIYGNPGCHCGVEGNGLFFDGINDYVDFPGIVNRSFNTTDFTVSFYIKPGKYSVFKQSLLSKRDSCTEFNILDFQLDNNRREIKTDLYETPNKYFKNISPEIPDTDWIHFALVRKGIYAYTYINGELRREAKRCSGVDVGNEAILSFSNSVCIETGRVVRFKGGIDELRIYDHALSDEGIQKIYSLHPVETAEVDCVSFIPEFNFNKTDYLCGK
jgi:hypothetical protein